MHTRWYKEGFSESRRNLYMFIYYIPVINIFLVTGCNCFCALQPNRSLIDPLQDLRIHFKCRVAIAQLSLI
jgi:hypothetical protein